MNNIDGRLNERIDLLADEIKPGLASDRPALAPDYVGWVLAELRNLGATGFKLAVDDTYIAGPDGLVTVDASQGLLANDIDEEFRVITVDTSFGMAMEEGFLAPGNGSVVVNDDGSFTDTAGPGFQGTDLFTYRSASTIEGVPDPVYSRPATVVLTSGSPAVPDTIFANSFEQSKPKAWTPIKFSVSDSHNVRKVEGHSP